MLIFKDYLHSYGDRAKRVKHFRLIKSAWKAVDKRCRGGIWHRTQALLQQLPYHALRQQTAAVQLTLQGCILWLLHGLPGKIASGKVVKAKQW